MIVENIIPRNMINNLGCASVDNHISRDDIFDYYPLRECNIYILLCFCKHIVLSLVYFYLSMTNRRHWHDAMKIEQLTKVSCSRFPHSKLKGIKQGFHFGMPLYTCTYTYMERLQVVCLKHPSPAKFCRLTDIFRTLKCLLQSNFG